MAPWEAVATIGSARSVERRLGKAGRSRPRPRDPGRGMLSNPSIGGDLGIARRIPDEGAFLDKTVEGLDAGPQELIGAVAPNWVDRANRLGVDPDGVHGSPGRPERLSSLSCPRDADHVASGRRIGLSRLPP